MGQNVGQSSKGLPLCVDLDGTLIRSDLLVESTIKLLTANPLYFFMLPLWLLQGRSVLKDELAKRVSINAAVLPYRESVLEHLQQEKSKGRELVLASASHESQVALVGKHLGLFSTCLGTSRAVNLKGSTKAQVLVDKFGEKGFEYAGDSKADLKVWQRAAKALVVSSAKSLVNDASKVSEISEHIAVKSSTSLKAVVRALRPHQWVKNILLVAPPILAQRIGEPLVMLALLKAFIAFSLCASAVYVLNDLADLESDRVHSKKSKRPFAAGDLSLIFGALLVPVLLLVSALFAASLPFDFYGVLAVYFLITTLYSFYLKQKALVDILTLATLFTLRIFAGGCATSIVVSPWLLAFSIFMFLSLASVKRYSELWSLKLANKETTPGRGYTSSDLELIGQSGIASGYIAVLVMALYINSPEMMHFYSHGQYLWLMCLPMLYWISRVWLLAYRGQMNEDPILFALKDFPSYLVGLLVVIILFIAM